MNHLKDFIDNVREGWKIYVAALKKSIKKVFDKIYLNIFIEKAMKDMHTVKEITEAYISEVVSEKLYYDDYCVVVTARLVKYNDHHILLVNKKEDHWESEENFACIIRPHVVMGAHSEDNQIKIHIGKTIFGDWFEVTVTNLNSDINKRFWISEEFNILGNTRATDKYFIQF